jgi:hypothetical protein
LEPPQVPAWAIKLVLLTEDVEEFENEKDEVK